MAGILDRLLGRGEGDTEPPAGSIPRVPLRDLFNNKRRLDLLKLEAHLRGTAHDHKSYSWEGAITKHGQEIPLGSYVPMRQRRPPVQLRLGKLIVQRFTTMVMGFDRFPTLMVEDDEEAQDYVRALADECKLRTRMIQARNQGGACGSVALSWGFQDGRPIVDVHSSAICEVLSWENFDRRIPSAVLEIYDYRKLVRRVVDGAEKMVDETFWHVRYWNTEIDQTWEAIPDALAKTVFWQSSPSTTVEHGAGRCPVLWVQNIPDSRDLDGLADADGQAGDFEELDLLASAMHRGTVANVDPTLVINDDKKQNEGVIRRGAGNVIYSKGGASLLTMPGDTLSSALVLMDRLRTNELDEAEVVLLDPDKLSGAGVSAASLRVRFAPMLAKCDVLREQYGDAIVALLRNLLEHARSLQGEMRQDEEGNPYRVTVELPPRVEETPVIGEDGEPEKDEEGQPRVSRRVVERTPGTSSRITLRWPSYFSADIDDKLKGIQTANQATGGKQILSRQTAIETIASMFGIDDVKRELARIEAEEDRTDTRAERVMGGGPKLRLQGEETEEEEPEEAEEE